MSELLAWLCCGIALGAAWWSWRRSQTATRELLATKEQLDRREILFTEAERMTEMQSDELQRVNSELEVHTLGQEVRRRELEEKNAELEETRSELEEHATALALADQYKSEFLANMSHELRTPLNAILLLSRLLGENRDGRLTDGEVEHCGIVHSAGVDLLDLINDVLDLAKIESGKQTFNYADVQLATILRYLQRTFEPLVEEKHLGFVVEMEKGVPEAVFSDKQRLEQIIKNLTANALKFTDQGNVTLRAYQPRMTEIAKITLGEGVTSEDIALAISVSDTGIGIPNEKQAFVFEAFSQADGSTNRKYGGTGLGLAISHELAQALGGALTLQSPNHTGSGSTFTLYLPLRAKLQPGATVVDVAKNSAAEAKRRMRVRNEAANSRRDAGETATWPEPVEKLNGKTGDEPATTPEEQRDDGGRLGTGISSAGAYRLLVVEDGELQREILRATLGEEGYEVTTAGSPEEALLELDKETFACAIVDLGLPELDRGLRLLEELKARGTNAAPPALVYTGKNLREDERAHLEELSQSIIIKGIKSFELLSDELQRLLGPTPGAVADAKAPEPRSDSGDPINDLQGLTGKRILVVDDDERNQIATQALLRAWGLQVTTAQNGESALTILAGGGHFDLVFTDIMMPGISGYEFIRRTKQMDRYAGIPVIALTANAMKGDRNKCIAAGASDYLSKPVDIDKLLRLLIRWLQ